MHKQSSIISVVAMFLAILLSSCGKETIVDLSHDVGDAWTKDAKVVFEYNIQDSIMPIDFYINIRNTTDYNYANVYFFIKTIYPNQRYSIDTLECFVANIKGEWLGSGFGKYRENMIPFKKNMRFPMTGNYRMEFEMAMRDSILDGIDALGIRIERAE
ncbi:MAG: gliding motility lipoprotein GldH [Bacteroidales bacterium]|nr:gliding motility lipoprotein GldH [Bacteroidales bacterium]